MWKKCYRKVEIIMLTEKQERFARYVAVYGYSITDAAKAAGYSAAGKNSYSHIAYRLANDDVIATRIGQLRDELFDRDSIFKDVVRTDRIALSFNVTDYIEVVEDFKETGEPFLRRRLKKKMSEWDSFALSNVVGYDKFGFPIFRSKEDASKELKRVFGFYKDNTEVVEQDTVGVLESAGLSPSTKPVVKVDDFFNDSFDGDKFDDRLELECEDIEAQEIHRLMNGEDY